MSNDFLEERYTELAALSLVAHPDLDTEVRVSELATHIKMTIKDWLVSEQLAYDGGNS